MGAQVRSRGQHRRRYGGTLGDGEKATVVRDLWRRTCGLFAEQNVQKCYDTFYHLDYVTRVNVQKSCSCGFQS